jgi:hypothetical protein
MINFCDKDGQKKYAIILCMINEKVTIINPLDKITTNQLFLKNDFLNIRWFY